mmetsp:Transcript_34519/g.90840  ORF Transcript_34519/g.90840 Transcript_34519/m.90840 type:complete len:439 (+) Transcript_34519:797-2113(+)
MSPAGLSDASCGMCAATPERRSADHVSSTGRVATFLNSAWAGGLRMNEPSISSATSPPAYLRMCARELTTQCSGILRAPALSERPISRSFAETISSTRSSPPLTFSASLRMPSRRFCSAASAASISLLSFLSDGISLTSASAVAEICVFGSEETVRVMPGNLCAFCSSSLGASNAGKSAWLASAEGVHARRMSSSDLVAESFSSSRIAYCRSEPCDSFERSSKWSSIDGRAMPASSASGLTSAALSRSSMETIACAVYALSRRGSTLRRSTKSESAAAAFSTAHIACGSATWPLGRTSRTPTLSCIDTSSSTASSPTPKRSLNLLMSVGIVLPGGSVAEDQIVLYGAASIACVMRPGSDVGGSASPLPWSAPIVGSSSMRIVLSGSSCLVSHAHDATSETKQRGGRITCWCRLRTRPFESPPAVSCSFSTPRRSFSSI